MDKPLANQVFLIDGIGALLSSLFLGVILPDLKGHIGLSRVVLYNLAIFPTLFLLYDFVCFRFLRSYFSPYVMFIAMLNAIYLVYSLNILYRHFHSLRPLDFIYFGLEIIIILVIITWEYLMALRIRKHNQLKG